MSDRTIQIPADSSCVAEFIEIVGLHSFRKEYKTRIADHMVGAWGLDWSNELDQDIDVTLDLVINSQVSIEFDDVIAQENLSEKLTRFTLGAHRRPYSALRHFVETEFNVGTTCETCWVHMYIEFDEDFKALSAELAFDEETAQNKHLTFWILKALN
jgi:hypothetical protein